MEVSNILPKAAKFGCQNRNKIYSTNMKLTDIIVTGPKTSGVFGKKTGKYFAHFVGDTDAEYSQTVAETPEAAIVALKDKAIKHMQNSLFRRYFWSKDGSVVLCLYYSEGYVYDISRPDGGTASCMMNPSITEAQAVEMAKKHAESYWQNTK